MSNPTYTLTLGQLKRLLRNAFHGGWHKANAYAEYGDKPAFHASKYLDHGIDLATQYSNKLKETKMSQNETPIGPDQAAFLDRMNEVFGGEPLNAKGSFFTSEQARLWAAIDTIKGFRPPVNFIDPTQSLMNAAPDPKLTERMKASVEKLQLRPSEADKAPDDTDIRLWSPPWNKMSERRDYSGIAEKVMGKEAYDHSPVQAHPFDLMIQYAENLRADYAGSVSRLSEMRDSYQKRLDEQARLIAELEGRIQTFITQANSDAIKNPSYGQG